MSFIFQPGTTRLTDHPSATTRAKPGPASRDRVSVVRGALEALTLGDCSRLDQIFTEDVQFRSPHVSVRSRVDLLQAVGEPDSVLSGVEITMSTVVISDAALATEWRVEATLIAPVLFGDNVLIEPMNDRLQLLGASFAQFCDDRIQVFRCYFDDSEMFDGVPGVMHPLRYTARWSGSPGGA